MKYITAVLLGILLIAHCGDRGEEIAFEDAQAVPVDTLSITSRLAIGAEEIDDEYGFAEVASICHAPDSSLLVVDPKMANVRRFSPTGELLMQYGSRGQGPGELTEPWDVAVSSGGFVFVSDLRGLNVYALDSGEWIVLDYHYTRPMLLRLLGNRDSTFTALHYSFDLTVDHPLRLAFYKVYSWTSPTEVSFWEDTSVAGHSNSEYTRLCAYQPIAAADADGNVYISHSTPSRLLVQKYSPDGNLLLTVDKEFEPVVLSEEDVPTGDDEDDYDRDTTEDEEEELVVTQEYDSATASTQEATDRPAAGPPDAAQRGGKGLFIAVIVILGILTVAVLLALKFLI